MDPVTSLRMSWRNVTDHALRSTLTTLGVVIGVGAVIAFVILGASLQADIVQTVAGENTDVVYVTAGSGGDSDVPTVGGGGQPVFTEHDVALLRGVDGVKWVIPQSGIATSNVHHGDDVVGRQFVTVTGPRYFTARGLAFVEGRTFRDGHREVVLNRQAATMFSENVSVGDTIVMVRAVNGEELNATVVGIVETPGDGESTGLVGTGGPQIYAPTRPYYQRTVVSPTIGESEYAYPQLLVVVQDAAEVDAVSGRVQTELATNSDARILTPQNQQIQVTTYDQLVEQVRQITNTFTAYIAGVAVIALVVGSIGIANIMLVSVTERRKEIGIMKAVGADSRDILQLFLNEATILGAGGAVIGAGVGLAAGFAATVVIGLPFRVRPEWFVVAVVVGVLTGVVAGVYPAWSAARTDPIDALRRG